jgi:hypothetical protein
MDWKINLTFEISDVLGLVKDLYNGKGINHHISIKMVHGIWNDQYAQASLVFQHVTGISQVSVKTNILPHIGIIKVHMPVVTVFHGEEGYVLKMGGTPLYDWTYKYSNSTIGYLKGVPYRERGEFLLHIDIPRWLPRTTISV